VSALRDAVERIDLDEGGKTYLRDRWFNQVEWLSAKAGQTQRRYYSLRMITGVGSAVVASLAGAATLGATVGRVARIAVFAFGLLIAMATGIEQLFRYGERWQHYRQQAEMLKTEGWLYLQLAGPYKADGATHQTALPAFAERIEDLLKADVDTYVTAVASDRESRAAV
jgi:hypothetical protein